MRIIRKSEFAEGRWRNGMGVSWDIASDPPGTEAFGWRFAIARIDADVPFSHYPEVDRIFTLLACGPGRAVRSISSRGAGCGRRVRMSSRAVPRSPVPAPSCSSRSPVRRT